ncbi:MAG: hypothetical protein ACI4QY_01015 [Oscillospiraceae bacterium]
MGRFSTTVQVKDNVGRMVFINSLCDVMKKRGFVPCSEDEAVLSYLLALGEGWVTLANEEYKDNPQKAYEDSREMAAALKTSAFSVEVVDSDFALLKLSDPNGGEDEVIVGDGSGYGIEEPTRGEQQYWEKLLANGITWEQFSETAAKNEVFVEDALAELAGVLGIEAYYICADYDEVSDKADENKNIKAFYFKKADAKAKTMSLNAAFKQVFGEALEPLGFKMIKSKYPYFVRVVPGREIIHIITYMEMWCPYHGLKEFTILSGIATVYRYKIDLNIPQQKNANWLGSISKFYFRSTPESEYDDEFGKSIYSFQFEEYSESSLYNALNYTLELTKKYILPQLSTAVDIRSSLSYLKRLMQSCCINNFDRDLNFGGCGDADEGFLYILADDEELKGGLEGKINGTIPCTEEEHQRAVENYEFFNDPVIHPKVLLEIERRKVQNTEILKSYGLDI